MSVEWINDKWMRETEEPTWAKKLGGFGETKKMTRRSSKGHRWVLWERGFVNWISINSLWCRQMKLHCFSIKRAKTKMLLLLFPFHRWEHWGLFSLGDAANLNPELKAGLLAPNHCFTGRKKSSLPKVTSPRLARVRKNHRVLGAPGKGEKDEGERPTQTQGLRDEKP